MARKNTRWLVLAVTTVAASALVAGCGGAQRDSGGSITASGAVGVTELAVGDCVNAPTGSATTVEDVAGVPCTQAHDGEVFLTSSLPEGPYPGAESVKTTTESLCTAAADSYLGVPLSETALEMYYLMPPNAEEWAKDRGIACILHHPGETLTQPLRGNGSQHLFTSAGMKVGQCVGNESMSVPCTTSHMGEVYVVGTMPDGTYTPDLADEIGAICEKAFTAYVGTDYSTSTLAIAPIVPTEKAWAAGDRAYACMLFDRNEQPMTGSAKGSGK